jgi:hypothetical protein
MNITYDKDNGLFVADGKVVETAKSILENNKDVTVSQGLLVDAIRLNMKENNMSPDSVCFIFNGGKITINEHYGLSDWPEGFCSVFEDILSKLIE